MEAHVNEYEYPNELAQACAESLGYWEEDTNGFGEKRDFRPMWMEVRAEEIKELHKGI